ncbi:MAG: nickel transporter [Hyphomicrobiaceae bacterium]|nr:nickel transporter [Hyphomicrobiaceae bacterium]
MQVIPVIDVRHGMAVRAVAGDRENYRQLASPLTVSPDPADVARGLMALHAFPVIYIADLDGIEGRGANARLAEDVAVAAGAGNIWLDRGLRPEGLGKVPYRPVFHDVLGTESGWDCAALGALTPTTRKTAVLSLDFRCAGFVGDAHVLNRADLWPDRVIVMTLGRVGGGGGPDLDTIGRIVATARTSPRPLAVYAAGGVRNRADLTALTHLGAAGALVSTALHAQTITAADLVRDQRP